MTDSSSAPEPPAEESGKLASQTAGAATSVRPRRNRKLLFCVFSLLPAAALIVTAEILIRVTQLDQPKFETPFLTRQDDPVHRHDSQLFFALRPDLDVDLDGVRVLTNSAGLRSAEIGPKQPGEYRILSLGESSTFGAFVEGDQTYSAQLEKQLQQADDGKTWRVINAGVSAYSSFQSLKFLELRGLEFEPDMVLLYHEINDFLPATVRGGESQDETGLALTDRELYESKRQSMHRRLLAVSAVYRLIHYAQLRRRLGSWKRIPVQSGNDAVPIPPNFYLVKSREGARLMNVPTRVPAEQREQILTEIKALCEQHDIQLVVIHPSYRESKQHECELTEFCRAAQVPMFESYHSLHPAGGNPNDWFLDMWHPNPDGHLAMAQDLSHFLLSSGLISHKQ